MVQMAQIGKKIQYVSIYGTIGDRSVILCPIPPF